MTDLRKLLEEGKIDQAISAATQNEDLGADLISYLEDADEEIKRAAFQVVAKVNDFPGLLEAVPMLIGGLESGEEDICIWAAEALSHIGADAAEAIEPLAALIDHDDDDVRRTVARAIGAIGSAAVGIIDRLIDALTDNDEVVRGEIALAISNIGSEAVEAVPRLVDMLVDEEEFLHNGKSMDVRAAAQKALWEIGPEAVERLLEALREDRPEQRIIAITTLAGMASLSEEAIQNLKDATQDPDEDVRKAAKSAIKRIQS